MRKLTVLKKIASITLAGLMVLSMVQPAVYAEEAESEVTIDFEDDSFFEEETDDAEQIPPDGEEEQAVTKEEQIPAGEQTESQKESSDKSADQKNTIQEPEAKERAEKIPEEIIEESGKIKKDQTLAPSGDAYLLEGPKVNMKIKQLTTGNPAATFNTKDTTIKHIVFSNDVSNVASDKNIADTGKGADIYASVNGDTLTIKTSAAKIHLAENSSYLMSGFSALTDVSLFDGSVSLDSSAVQNLYFMFRDDTALASLNLSGLSIPSGTNQQRMFQNAGISALALGNGWKFENATNLVSGNWKSSKSGEVWSTAALENKFTAADAATFTQTSDPATIKCDELFEANGGLEPNNIHPAESDGGWFTGFCINHNNHFPYGYYEKVEATPDLLVNGKLLSSGDFGYAPIGNDMREALIALIYYGTEENMNFDTLQNDIWHFTDSYSDAIWGRGSVWADKKFSSIPNHDSYVLYIYQSKEGFQNILSIEGVEEEQPTSATVKFNKKDSNGAFVAGAELTITGTNYKSQTMTPLTVKTEDKKTYQLTLQPGEYTITETKTPPGYQTAAPISISVSFDGVVTCSAMKDGVITIVDELNEGTISISKQDIAGNELPGATLVITKGNEELYRWESQSTPHVINDILPGDYVLTEITQPNGYVKAESIEFTVALDGTVTSDAYQDGKLVMTDAYEPHTVSISKRNIAGEEIPGAVLKVEDKDHNEIDSWTSAAGQSHEVDGLMPGTYTLIETQQPNGYVKAESITFTVDIEGKVTSDAYKDGKIVMTDQYSGHDVEISKRNIAGEEIPGASLVVTDKKGVEIDKWTSVAGKSHTVKNLVPGTYTLTETLQPDGYKKAESITFTVKADGTVESDAYKDGKVVMTDQYAGNSVEISKQNIAGEEIPGASLVVTDKDGAEIDQWTSVAGKSHVVKDLVPGTYTLTETLQPDGYKKAEAITFTVKADGTVESDAYKDGKVVMTDEYVTTSVVISKRDIAGEEIPGAVLRVVDGKLGVIDYWTSVKGVSHEIRGLRPGTYTLIEVTAPAGYEKAANITFVVDKEGKVTSSAMKDGVIVMTDNESSYTVKIRKTDVAGKEIAGATLTVTDKNGAEKDKWVSEAGKVHEVKGLKEGDYTLTEVTQPAGYLKAESIPFHIDKNGNVSSDHLVNGAIMMVDREKTTAVKIRKVDIAGKEIAGAVLQIKGSDDKLYDTWTSEAGKIHESPALPAGTYTLTEFTAPNGYEKAESITFTVAADGTVTSKNQDANGNIVMTDKYSTSSVAIKKTDIAGNEIEGASLTVTHTVDGKTVTDDKWTSVKGQTHIVKDLQPGTYTLTEVTAPNGYEKAESIQFVVDQNGKVSVNGSNVEAVTMVDAYAGHDVVISKQDIAGKEIPGAQLTVTKEDGTTVDQWTSEEGKSHIIKGLKPGTYILTERVVPENYEQAESITFVVLADGSVTVGKDTVDKVIMKDGYKPHEVHVRKLNEKNAPLADAKLKIVHSENQQKVTDAEWKSTADVYTAQLKPGNYILQEVEAPNGYEVAADISFTVMVDGSVMINGSKQANETITMIDKAKPSTFEVEFEKMIEGGSYLAGAALEVAPKDNTGTAKVSWTSENGSKKLALLPGSYVFRETSAPAGYLLANEIAFTVGTDGVINVNGKTVQKITMTDKPTTVSIRKVDASGAALAGASLTVKDESGNAVDTWTSDSNAHVIKGKLAAGKTYVLHENSAPAGYRVAADIQFKVGQNAETVVMKDEKETEANTSLVIKKVVAGTSDQTQMTREFEFSIKVLDGNGKPVTGSFNTDANSTITLDASGVGAFKLAHGKQITIKGLPSGSTYAVAEKDYSSEGYSTKATDNVSVLNSGSHTVTFTNTFGSTKESERVVTNQIVTRETGDASHLYLWVASLLVLSGVVILSIKRIKR